MESSDDARCSSPSSTGSFDSCSDLLGSLRGPHYLQETCHQEKAETELSLDGHSGLEVIMELQQETQDHVSSSEVGQMACLHGEDNPSILEASMELQEEAQDHISRSDIGQVVSVYDEDVPSNIEANLQLHQEPEDHVSSSNNGSVTCLNGERSTGHADNALKRQDGFHDLEDETLLESVSLEDSKSSTSSVEPYSQGTVMPEAGTGKSDRENNSCSQINPYEDRLKAYTDFSSDEISIKGSDIHNKPQNNSGILNIGEVDPDLKMLEDSIKAFDLRIEQPNSKGTKTVDSSCDKVKNETPVAGKQKELLYNLNLHSSGHKDANKYDPQDSKYRGKDPSLSSVGSLSQLSVKSKKESSTHMIDEEGFKNTSDKKDRTVRNHNKSGESVTWTSKDLGPDELFRFMEVLDVNETYMDAIHGMEDPHLATNEIKSHVQMGHTLSPEDIPFSIDMVEVVGARQRRGSSVWERMVGVKEHTVYCIKVVSGNHQWEVLRRYRDFLDFYHQLKQIFSSQKGTVLPQEIEELGNESLRAFGNISPNVVEVRRVLIERCLQSVIQAGPPLSTTPPLFWFLRPPETAFVNTGFEDHQVLTAASSIEKGLDVQLGALDSSQLKSPRQEILKLEMDQDPPSPFRLGKTIKLVLFIHAIKPIKHLLEIQHYSCAGCYKHLDVERVMRFTRGKPRLCEYTGQLYCSICHLNEFAVLPAHVLRHWDFTPRRVSQLAKSYLDSIYDQPLLSVSAANPYLYSRVPILLYVKETRSKISRVLSCIRCPSHGRIQQIMGSRRYLLENNDFFALRELEDLSKGAFAVLPGLLSAILEKLKVHVKKQCSMCQDTGEWCGAGILCEDAFHPIFPFEEENVVSCQMCSAPFHQKCFLKCSSCPACPKDWLNNKSGETSEVQRIARNEDLNYQCEASSSTKNHTQKKSYLHRSMSQTKSLVNPADEISSA